MRHNKLYKLNAKGEIIDVSRKNVEMRFKPDSLFYMPGVSAFVILVCVLVDLANFYTLFATISSDSPLQIVMQVAGLLFGFDIVMLYCGIEFRKYKQGLNHHLWVIILGLVAFGFAVFINTVLRIRTVDLMAGSSTSTAFSETVQTQDSDPIAIAQMLFGIMIPFVTSIGTFFISYVTYNPLLKKQQKLAEQIAYTRDCIRRYNAILDDYAAQENALKMLSEEDEMQYHAMLQYYIAKAYSYYDYVVMELKEKLADPAENSVLSQFDFDKFSEELRSAIEIMNVQIDCMSDGSANSIDISEMLRQSSNYTLHKSA